MNESLPSSPGSPEAPENVKAPSLAILFMVLSLGTLLDLGSAPHSPEAMQYYHLGRAALAIDNIFEDQSIAAIQALVGPLVV